MPKIVDTQEDHMKRALRDAMAIDPLITVRGLQAVIEKKYNRTLSLNYLLRLIKKVRGEIQVRYGPDEARRVIVQLRETVRVLRAEALRIAYPDRDALDKPSHADRLRALELIAKLEKQQAVLEASFRVYTMPDGSTKELDTGELSEVEKQIADAAEVMGDTWGFTPPETRRIEAREVPAVETKKDQSVPPAEPVAPTPTLIQGQKIVKPTLHGGFQIQP